MSSGNVRSVFLPLTFCERLHKYICFNWRAAYRWGGGERQGKMLRGRPRQNVVFKHLNGSQLISTRRYRIYSETFTGASNHMNSFGLNKETSTVYCTVQGLLSRMPWQWVLVHVCAVPYVFTGSIGPLDDTSYGWSTPRTIRPWLTSLDPGPPLDNQNVAMLIRPRPMCPRPNFLGYCIPWTKRPLDVVSLIKPSLNWVWLTSC